MSFFFCSGGLQYLHSFPTRRSSDLPRGDSGPGARAIGRGPGGGSQARSTPRRLDRKSTRLNSSHITNSYAVFCLKKKKLGLEIRLVGQVQVDEAALAGVHGRELRSE